MSKLYHETGTNLPDKTVTRATSQRFASGPLELNVIFTDPEATAAALNFAQSFAGELGARIRLRAAIAVPHQLPLDQPPVSVVFLQENLRNLTSKIQVAEGFEPIVDLYLCRDRASAFLQVLRPSSLVVLGGRKRWWPTDASRLARALRAKGHRVIFVDSKAQVLAVRPTIEPKVFVR